MSHSEVVEVEDDNEGFVRLLVAMMALPGQLSRLQPVRVSRCEGLAEICTFHERFYFLRSQRDGVVVNIPTSTVGWCWKGAQWQA